MKSPTPAVPDLAAIEIDGITRQSFILRGALATGAVYGIGTVAPFVQQALAQEGGGDVDILNFALTLEVLEAEFYKRALRDVPDLSAEASELAKEIGANEAEHVAALEQTISDLGGEPVEAPKLVFGKSFDDEATFLETAVTLEDTGVSAYNGAAPLIENKDVLAAAGSIVQIEGRHAALIRSLAGETPTIAAFDEPLEQQQVLDAVQPFIKA